MAQEIYRAWARNHGFFPDSQTGLVWRIGLTTGRNSRSGVVLPLALVVPDFDMARRDKLFDFVSGVGRRSVLESALGLKNADQRHLGHAIALDEVFEEVVRGIIHARRRPGVSPHNRKSFCLVKSRGFSERDGD